MKRIGMTRQGSLGQDGGLCAGWGLKAHGGSAVEKTGSSSSVFGRMFRREIDKKRQKCLDKRKKSVSQLRGAA